MAQKETKMEMAILRIKMECLISIPKGWNGKVKYFQIIVWFVFSRKVHFICVFHLPFNQLKWKFQLSRQFSGLFATPKHMVREPSKPQYWPADHSRSAPYGCYQHVYSRNNSPYISFDTSKGNLFKHEDVHVSIILTTCIFDQLLIINDNEKIYVHRQL